MSPGPRGGDGQGSGGDTDPLRVRAGREGLGGVGRLPWPVHCSPAVLLLEGPPLEPQSVNPALIVAPLFLGGGLTFSEVLFPRG